MGRILVVDDNDQLCELVKDVVESWGHTVYTAAEGRSCLDMVARELPDIILLDVMLPGLSGYEVCKKLKGNPLTRNISVIMMTALSDIEDRIHGFKVGADNFLVKPINYEELQAIVNKFMKDKICADTMEPRKNVVNVLNKIMCAIGDKRLNSLVADELLYAKKLADNLSLSNEAEDRLMSAIILQHVGTIIAAGKAADLLAAGLDLLEDLRLIEWLKPVLLYSTSDMKNAGYEELKAKVKLADMETEADILMIINRFAWFLSEKDGNISLALSLLKREGFAKEYNSDILKRLEQIINDEKILSNIK
ncbi:MAG: response regulator [Acidaminococcaceae bacterium]